MANTLISSMADHVVVRKTASMLAQLPGYVVCVVVLFPAAAAIKAGHPSDNQLSDAIFAAGIATLVPTVIATTAGYIYFIPSRVAAAREHPACVQILALNLFLGWTLLGWVGALIWSLGHTGGLDKPA